jgi:electron transport complex protein RnfG
MAKQESGFKVIAVLVVIAVFSAALLAYVNKVTKGPIEENKKAEMKRAITIVLKGINTEKIPEIPETIKAADYDENKTLLDSAEVKYFKASDDSGRVLGLAFMVKGPNGFSGDFDIMVGVDASSGKIIDTYVLQHKETPGLGDKMSKEPFKSYFPGRSLQDTKWKVKKDGGDIDALTAATITSRAFTKGVKRALLAYSSLMEGKE